MIIPTSAVPCTPGVDYRMREYYDWEGSEMLMTLVATLKDKIPSLVLLHCRFCIEDEARRVIDSSIDLTIRVRRRLVADGGGIEICIPSIGRA